MLRCVDTFSEIPALFPRGVFELAPWRAYAQAHFGSGASLFEDDMNDCLKTGSYTYERDFLPVLQAVWNHPRLEEMHQSFLAAAKGLSERLAQKFGGGLDADLFLYVGLCNGAGWATKLNGRDAVLLGMEKILELGWVSLADMQGLIYHELGHIYHGQHGCFCQKVGEGPSGLCGSCLLKAPPCISSRSWWETRSFTSRTKTAGRPGAAPILLRSRRTLTRTCLP